MNKPLTLKEANQINEEGQEIPGTQNYHEHGFDLDILFDGKEYRLTYDHQTYFTGIGFARE